MDIMKKRVAALGITIGMFLLSAARVSAQVVNGISSSNTAGTKSTTTTSTQPPVNQPLAIHINNPLKVNTITDAIKLLSSVVIRIALPLIIIFFIWSGLSFIFARGNPEGVKKAKNMFFFTVIGTLLILGAWTITNAIIGTINAVVS